MPRKFFTSDLHLNHASILLFCPNRPFKSIEEMNEKLIENWNSVVSEEDSVYVLGDMLLGPMEESLKLISRLKGQKILVTGNHDRPSLLYHKKYIHKTKEENITAKIQEWKDRYMAAGFSEVIDSSVTTPVIYFEGQTIKLNHMPYLGDHPGTEDRFVEFRPIDEQDGSILFHGHIHDYWKFKPGMINVGVDVWNFKPTEIQQLLREYKESHVFNI